ncbi:MAG: glycosyltransferase family 2 protein [Flavobacteriales bacterium]|nr:glycosyltransferase family 2 protein [Flavobacteriales bacterium]
MDLSVVIITFNEEKNIQRCIDSVKGIASEVLIVDSFSKDQTESIATKAGARFIQRPFEGHIEQKNYAWQQAKHEWILSLDADEALTPELAESIQNAITSPEADGYKMNRLTYYCGHWVKHSGWYPDTKLRLFKKNKGAWGGVNPHDKFELNDRKAPVPHLQGDILHYSYYTKEDHFKQIEYFSKIAATELHQKGVSKPTIMIYLKVIAQFFKNYFLKTGFLDGKTGWLIATRSAFATYRKYTILKELNNG